MDVTPTGMVHIKKDNEWSYVAQISYSLRHLDVLNVRCGLSKANRVAVINCLL